MTNIPSNSYNRHLIPADHVEYEVTGTVRITIDVPFHVVWEEPERLPDMDDDRLINAMWDILVADLRETHSSWFHGEDQIDDITIEKAREAWPYSAQ